MRKWPTVLPLKSRKERRSTPSRGYAHGEIDENARQLGGRPIVKGAVGYIDGDLGDGVLAGHEPVLLVKAGSLSNPRSGSSLSLRILFLLPDNHVGLSEVDNCLFIYKKCIE